MTQTADTNTSFITKSTKNHLLEAHRPSTANLKLLLAWLREETLEVEVNVEILDRKEGDELTNIEAMSEEIHDMLGIVMLTLDAYRKYTARIAEDPDKARALLYGKQAWIEKIARRRLTTKVPFNLFDSCKDDALSMFASLLACERELPEAAEPIAASFADKIQKAQHALQDPKPILTEAETDHDSYAFEGVME